MSGSACGAGGGSVSAVPICRVRSGSERSLGVGRRLFLHIVNEFPKGTVGLVVKNFDGFAGGFARNSGDAGAYSRAAHGAEA